MEINYQYELEWTKIISTWKHNANILDFGSGPCEVVFAGRKLNYNIFGADTFYDGMDKKWPDKLKSMGYYNTVVREIKEDSTGYSNNFFDLVLSNMVFEHVKDLDVSVKEIARILKPKGFLISLFPQKEVFMEGHLIVPLIHWFSKKNIFRIPYLSTIGALFRILGTVANNFAKKGVLECDVKKINYPDWIRRNLEFIDGYTYYRTRKEIKRIYEKFFKVYSLEDHFINFYLNKTQLPPLVKKIYKNSLIKSMVKIFYIMVYGQVLLCVKK